MDIKIKKDDLQPLVALAQSVSDKNNTMPALSNVFLEANEEHLYIYSTNLELSLISKVPLLECLSTGSSVVSARNLFQLIKELDEDKIHLYTDERKALCIEQSRALFKLRTMLPDEFPDFPELREEEFVKIKAKSLAEMLQRTLYSVSNDDSRQHLNGVYFEGNPINKNFSMVATDGHRLSMAFLESSESLSKIFKEGIIVPKRGLSEIKRILENLTEGVDDDVEIAVQGAHFLLRTNTSSVMIRLIEGAYPDYKRFIPEELLFYVIINKEQFVSSLRRVSLLSNQKSKNVTLDFAPGKLKIYSNSPDLGLGKEEIDIVYNEKEFRIGFNSKYILESLNIIEEEEVKILFKDTNAPAVFLPNGSTEYKSIVMPMRAQPFQN